MKPGRWSGRLFRLMLRVFPMEFRRDFGSQMAADFEDQRETARLRGGRFSATGVWLRTSTDFARRGPTEHFDILRRDVRHAVRVLRRRPTLTITAIVTLALAVGLNTAVFSVVNGVLLRALPAPESDRLVRLFQLSPPPEREAESVSPPNFLDWMERTKTLAAVTFITGGAATLLDGGDPEALNPKRVSAGFFDVVGVQPAMGRAFVPDDYAALSALRSPIPSVVILSHDLWMRRFGGRKDILGTTVRFGRETTTVIGVMPRGFFLSKALDGEPVDCWLPLAPDRSSRRARYGTVIGRLAAGTTLAEAQAELSAIAAGVEREHPEDFGGDRGQGALVSSLRDTMVSDVRVSMWVLFGVVACVLLIGCANVASLLLALASGRRGELATRLALGATRARLVRESITEALVLSLSGGVVGAVLAWWTLRVLTGWVPAGLPRLDEITMDAGVWLFAFLLSSVVGVGCGLVISFSMRGMQTHLTVRSQLTHSSRRSSRFKQALIVADVALALVLVIAASLLVRTMRAVNALDLGFVPGHVVSVGLNPNIRTASDFEKSRQQESDVVARIRALPGVVAAGVGSRPLDWGGVGTSVSLPGQPQSESEVAADAISDGYLEALGARLMDGRQFTANDRSGAPAVTILNRTAAKRFFADRPAVGKTIVVGDKTTTVVGLIADVRRKGLEVDPAPTVYLPTLQARQFLTSNLLIRTAGDPKAIVPAVRVILRELDPLQALSRTRILDELLDDTKAPRRFAMQLVGGFSALALVLAMIGLYGVIAESVAQRVPEIGIRMALGATSAQIVGSVVQPSAVLVAAGLGIGLAGAIALQGVMAKFVFGVEATDVISYVVAGALLAIAAVGASLIPARRAAAIDPLVALRQD